MVLIFDLDDTLYPEITYVESGFRAVATWLENEFSWNTEDSLFYMMSIFKHEGRGLVFNRLLERHNKLNQSLVKKCIRIYRHHLPSISLFPAADNLLRKLGQPLYIVTDGHKVVQEKKVNALGINARFKKVFITHRYGLYHAKPSIYCFERIREREQCDWTDMVYIGDNPAKDFVNLNPLGVLTIRVRTGEHQHMPAQQGYEAKFSINGLHQLPALIASNVMP